MNAMLEDNGSGSSHQSDSGWTSYLQHSSYSYYSLPSPPCNNNHRVNKSYRNKRMVSKEGVHETDNAGDFCQEAEAEVEEEEEEEEDLSMVSDASSGPPHFDLNDVDGDRNMNRQSIGSHNCKFKNRCEGKDFAHLDDTASSPLFFSPKKMNNGGGLHNVEDVSSSLESLMDYSNSPALSATHFQERSRNLQEGYDFFQSPYSADRFQQDQWS